MATTGYRHGVYTSEIPTSILPARVVNSAVVFAVGCAAVHTKENPIVNEPKYYTSYDEFVSDFGWDADNFNDYSLQEVIYSHFALYRGAPVIVVNVFDPQKHASEVEDEQVTFSTALLTKDIAQLAHAGVRSLTLRSASESKTYVENTDYTVDTYTGTITRVEGGAIAEGAAVLATYVYADVSKVKSADIIGGIDPTTGNGMGLELIDEVFARYREVPSIVLAPKYCEDPDVAIVMAAKCDGINSLFKAICVVDIPSSGENAVTRYSDVPGYKEKNNLTDPLMIVCWPKVMLADNVYGLSTHLAGLMADTDANNGGYPYASPSNKLLSITSFGYMDKNNKWTEAWLDLTKANYLNGQGVYTVTNFDGGLKSWGGRMACYPSNTDPKDAWDSIRRFLNYYQVQFILTYFSEVDRPMTRRFIQTILKSEQIKLDGMAAREIILGGTISFDESENPLTDLIDGVARFHIRITPPVPARDIEAEFEFDPDNLNNLFA